MTYNKHGNALRLGTATTPLVAMGLVLAAAGFATAYGLGWLRDSSHALFFHAYLVAYIYFLWISLGALFFVLLHHLSRAGWSVTLRRLSEALSGNIWLMVVLLLPLLLHLDEIYPWARPGAAKTLGDKAVYLNSTAFIVRLALYFVVWGGLATLLRQWSIKQDASGDVRLSAAMERLAAPGMILFAFTVTFASFDLVMSLNPQWFSTMLGVYFFADALLTFLVVLMLLTLSLQRSGRLGGAVTVEHYHDLGKLTFTMVFFWGYIAFSQYMLIWYANLPQETQFFLPRQLGPWAAVSLLLLASHLLLPFVGLLSRHARRHLGVFTFWAVWLLAATLLDAFWLIMPNLYTNALAPPGTSLPAALKGVLASRHSVYTLAAAHADFMTQVRLPLEASSLAVVLGLVVGMGGLYLANTARLLRGAALIPVEDPRLQESLAFENP